MRGDKREKCFCSDIGRKGCPCVLADSGECMGCSRLSGGSCNDCNWQGTCVYTLWHQNKEKTDDRRREITGRIVEIRPYTEDFRVYILEVPRGFCQRCRTVGSFVFVRRAEDELWFSMPVSILKAEPDFGRVEQDTAEVGSYKGTMEPTGADTQSDVGRIHLGIYKCGPKSKRLMEEKEKFILRGVYCSGLSGIRTLSSDISETAVYAKGIAVAPLRNMLDSKSFRERYLRNCRFKIDVEKIGMDFINDYFGDLQADKMSICDFAKEGITRPTENSELWQDNNIIALTSPYYADKIREIAGKDILRPNESNMCCGEGVCGACTCNDGTGKTIHRCKAR